MVLAGTSTFRWDRPLSHSHVGGRRRSAAPVAPYRDRASASEEQLFGVLFRAAYTCLIDTPERSVCTRTRIG